MLVFLDPEAPRATGAPSCEAQLLKSIIYRNAGTKLAISRCVPFQAWAWLELFKGPGLL